MADDLKIDFGSTESCQTYLMSKFDDLLTGINHLYGKALMNELILRLEKTIAQFHQDLKSLLADIQSPESGQSLQNDAAGTSDSTAETDPQNQPPTN